ncbi:probable DNA gyrase subunit A, chloroplastic/mitochondrial [Zingiber officinale]|uniref:probable DNA gyrase subunit A, chloroplastic/mitochondrial n=1 Tax=Zingiber officinale TaxID=94328 RepID=UPI001C4B4D03|nr:probable DNA gyrase subunit A, chloroplastic/mitochondrial [Zingiber officinale]
MAFSTMLRLGSSSVLLARGRPFLFLPAISALLPSSRRVFVELRPLSTASRRAVRPVRAKRRDREEEPSSAAKQGRGDDGSGPNGGVLVKERSGTREARIVPTELHTEAKESYMAYAMSVLVGRALPDVRDGLKPVHRRILYAMHELGLSSRKPFKKCARVVGEVLGKFHPHGDTAVYDSLVRMAQDFSLRCPLINGHGNFGSIDADPAAAMRYTECRLQALTEAMLLTDLDFNTVDFVPNFDNSQKEPSLLPARLPNLLLNGSSGIAVGMATNIPPHNLGELVDALSVLIHNPEATLQELLEYMPGPDFPTGGLILGNSGILETYKSGRGRIIVRGKTDVEMLDEKSKRSAIIIKEIPYQTNKSALVEKIAELVEQKILDGISDIRDESDRFGMRVVIELKRGSDPSIVLNNLYRHTALQSSFSCNMVGILDGQPKLMGLKELLQAFLDFRSSVIERRAAFKLSQALERKHIIEGIIIGLDNLDDIINIIRKTSSNALAITSLVKGYHLSEKQAEALLDITLRKLTLLERKKFVDEAESLSDQISNLNELLSSKKLIFQLIEKEAIELKHKFGSPRRSFIEYSGSSQLEEIDVIPNVEMLLTLSEKGYLKRMKPNTFTLQHRGTIGKSVGKMRVNDLMSDFIVCHTHDHILYFSDKGIVYSARAYKIPECSRTATGTPLVQLLSLSEGERITSIVPVSEFIDDQYLVMLTLNGYIKKVSLKAFSAIRPSGIIAIQLVAGDELKWVRLCADADLVALASQKGMVIVNFCSKLRALGRKTRGVISMKLKGDKMASMDVIPASIQKDLQKLSENIYSRGKDLGPPWLLFVSESGHGKRVPLSAFRLSNFNRVGLLGYKLPPDCRLAAVYVVGFSLSASNEDGESDGQLVLVSQSGTVNRIKVRDISIQSRASRGVILMRLEYAGKIQSASLISGSADNVGDDD